MGEGQSGKWAGARLMGHLRATEGGATVGAHLLVHACAHAIMSQENDSQLGSLDKAIDSFSTYEAYTALAADLLGTSAPDVLAKDCLVLCQSLSFVLTLPPDEDTGAEPRQTASTSQCIEK